MRKGVDGQKALAMGIGWLLVNGLDRLRAKWPLAERRYWATIRKVDAEREKFKDLHLLGYVPCQLFVSFFLFFWLRFANA